jgi:hypothetical protein
MPVRRWLRMRPMPGLGSHAADPVHPPVAAPAVEEEPPELALQLCFRLEELDPETLRCD